MRGNISTEPIEFGGVDVSPPIRAKKVLVALRQRCAELSLRSCNFRVRSALTEVLGLESLKAMFQFAEVQTTTPLFASRTLRPQDALDRLVRCTADQGRSKVTQQGRTRHLPSVER